MTCPHIQGQTRSQDVELLLVCTILPERITACKPNLPMYVVVETWQKTDYVLVTFSNDLPIYMVTQGV